MSAFNILLLGKTGHGKSTTGNKLLQLKDCEGWIKSFDCKEEIFPVDKSCSTKYCDSNLEEHVEQNLIPLLEDDHSAFAAASTHRCTKRHSKHHKDAEELLFAVDELSAGTTCTKRPKYLVNTKTDVSVIDTPGSAATSELFGEHTVESSNFQIFREIIQYQMHLPRPASCGIHRVLYFLSVRGALTKADAYTVNDLKTILHFYGAKIFESMVIVATRDPDDGTIPLPQSMLEKTAISFRQCLENIGHPMKCPPIIFIGTEDTGAAILEKVRNASVPNETFNFDYAEGLFCSKCSRPIRSYHNKECVVVGTKFNTNDDLKCHSEMVSKYTTSEKVCGTIIHVISLGMLKLVEWCRETDYLPSIRNQQLICSVCEESPGKPGCSSVNGNDVDHVVSETPLAEP